MKDNMHVNFRTSSGKELKGELKEAPDDQLVIVCHGYKSSSQAHSITSVTNGLNAKGYATFAFDFPEGSEIDIRQQVADITDIVEHFDNYRRFVLLATSYGAVSAAIAAIKIAKVTGLITVNGFFGQGKLGKERRRTFIKFRLASLVLPRYRKIWKYFKNELQPGKLTVPALVIHSQIDQVVSIEQSRYFFDKVSSPKEFVTLESATHGLSSPNDVAAVIAATDVWLKQR